MLYPFELRAQILFTLQRIVINDLCRLFVRLANDSLFGNIRPQAPCRPSEVFDTVQFLRYCLNSDSA